MLRHSASNVCGDVKTKTICRTQGGDKHGSKGFHGIMHYRSGDECFFANQSGIDAYVDDFS